MFKYDYKSHVLRICAMCDMLSAICNMLSASLYLPLEKLHYTYFIPLGMLFLTKK